MSPRRTAPTPVTPVEALEPAVAEPVIEPAIPLRHGYYAHYVIDPERRREQLEAWRVAASTTRGRRKT